ncbi:uncharacterized protein LOC126668410 [Mercurialis annua]|uniref:uncharacterized protein LOC126668410 n=1 Tax=Mercurialis annua TaxID=3986 RepID=UPI00215E7F91|nr:uncharacterized protein LOC126668410 [Mercurialis annua]
MLSAHNLSFIGLVESKKELIDEFLVRKIWPNLDFSFDFVPSISASGGLLLIWNKVLLNNFSVSKGARWICMDFAHNNDLYRHVLICDSNVTYDRSLLWHELNHLMGFMGIIFSSGDFNEIMALEERLNSTGFTALMLALRDFVNNCELLDLPLQGRLFTWLNSYSKSRIDRCLISATACPLWPNMTLTTLPSGQSDHVPICFRSENGIDWGLKPFSLVDAWWDHNSFGGFVNDSWSLLRKSRTFCKKIHPDDIAGKSNLKRRRPSMGDKNTKFFHSIASNHYRNNYIASFLVDGIIYTEPQDICFHIREFYYKLYSRQDTTDFVISVLNFATLNTVEGDFLVKSFEETEVFHALCSCGIKKAPGPDGFNFYFYRKAWPVIKKAIMELFDNFQHFNILPKDINSSFVVLIPKVEGSTNIQDYRLIILVNGIYKRLSKVLSRRLAPLLSSVISANQHVFLKGRSILECSTIANELIHVATRRKEKLLVLKLDFQKAFDSIGLDYLLSVMSCMNFPEKWIKKMSWCLFSGSTSVLVNGSPANPIPLRRGVHQGDPISPYLFHIAVEGLPLSNRTLSTCSWHPVVERFKSRMALWKGSLLSPAGREIFLLGCCLRSLENLFAKTLKMEVRINNRESLWYNTISSCSNITNWNSLFNGDVKKMSFIWKGIKKACCTENRAWRTFINTSNTMLEMGVQFPVGMTIGVVWVLSVFCYRVIIIFRLKNKQLLVWFGKMDGDGEEG